MERKANGTQARYLREKTSGSVAEAQEESLLECWPATLQLMSLSKVS